MNNKFFSVMLFIYLLLASCSSDSNTAIEPPDEELLKVKISCQDNWLELGQNHVNVEVALKDSTAGVSKWRYCLSPDTTLQGTQPYESIAQANWFSTDSSKFLITPLTIGQFFRDSVYCDTINSIVIKDTLRITASKLFVYAQNSEGKRISDVAGICLKKVACRPNLPVVISLTETAAPGNDIITSRPVEISWYAQADNINDLTFHYAVNTDMQINESNASQLIPSDQWQATNSFKTMISFPADGDSMKYYIDNSVSPVDTVKVHFSKLFIYAKNSAGQKSNTVARIYGRTNNLPGFPRVQCVNFGWYASTNFEYSTFQTTVVPRYFYEGMSPVRFSWQSSDPDGSGTLAYRWEVRKLNSSAPLTEQQMQDSNYVLDLQDNMITQSSGWSTDNVLDLDDEIYTSGTGYYKLIVYVRDDARQTSIKPTVCFFEAFQPTFSKGILLTDLTKAATATEMKRGFPDKVQTADFYKQMLNYCGYSESAGDNLKMYNYSDNLTELDLRKMSEYRLLILYSDSRDSKQAFFYTSGSGSFSYLLQQYLNLGGKVMIVGQNMIIAPNAG